MGLTHRCGQNERLERDSVEQAGRHRPVLNIANATLR